MSTSLGSEGGGGGGWEDGTGAGEIQFPDDEPPNKRSRKRTKQGVYTSDITLDDLAAHFHQPASKACQELGMGLTIFKRVCRKLGLQRWPYEKPCKADGEPTSGGARPASTPRGTGSWHLPPATQAWAGIARAGTQAAAPGGSRASSGQASGQELVAAAAQIEGALQQQDRRVRSAAIQHLAEILVKDSEAAEELLAAIGTAVQQQQQQQLPVQEGQQHQQHQQQEQQPEQQHQRGEIGRQQHQHQHQQQQQQQSLPQALLPPPPAVLQPLARRQHALVQPSLHSQLPAQQQQGTVEQLLAALQDAQPPVSQPLSMLLQQPALPMDLSGQRSAPAQQLLPLPATLLPPGPQQPAPPQQQDDLAAVLDVLRSALAAQAGTDAQLGSGLTNAAQQAQQAIRPQPLPQQTAVPGGQDRITPLLQQLLSWGQPQPQPQPPVKQEQPAVGPQPQPIPSVAALRAAELPAKQQQQQGKAHQPQPHQQGPQTANRLVPDGSIGAPSKPQQALAMELVVAAAQRQASSHAPQPTLPGAPQQHNTGLSAAELTLLAAIQQVSVGAAVQPAATLQQAPAGLAPAGEAISPGQGDHVGHAAPQPPAL